MAIKRLITEDNHTKDRDERSEVCGVDREAEQHETLQALDGAIEDVEETIFPNSVRFPTYQKGSHTSAEKGVLTIVNAGKYGNRLILPEKVISYTECNEKIQIRIADEGAIFSGEPSLEKEEEGVFTLKKQGKSYMIYCSSLVKEIVETFSLNYSDTVSKTFSDAQYGIFEGRKAVYIKLV